MTNRLKQVMVKVNNSLLAFMRIGTTKKLTNKQILSSARKPPSVSEAAPHTRSGTCSHVPLRAARVLVFIATS